ncbi:uncharacterized protein EV420DRAFT_1487384 [Desarmillaria tabescens]|uniref:Cullin family profile domain-containing protein n=1 Tax=Armillaria tabescens TaxID=1929756 RepID=A0AA39J627_ARMTA|nr:uncharacterized protein EV420DRAFT_1487384 [Desarmillaria tabescens]KAK0436825.1 hypothetical protein EV420DRAFT_1487384 [Desarmillaria tabescens]
MIARLRNACRSEYINKLRQMFTDARVSKDLAEQFDDEIFSVITVVVLGSNSLSFNRPSREIYPANERFQKYYQMRHSGELPHQRILVNEESGQYGLDSNFKSKKIRADVDQLIKAERPGQTEAIRAVQEGQKPAIQATIVRHVDCFGLGIMKTQKSMTNQQLVQEAVEQISQRFMPQVPANRKAIDILLEKQCIKREGDVLNIYKEKECYIYICRSRRTCTYSSSDFYDLSPAPGLAVTRTSKVQVGVDTFQLASTMEITKRETIAETTNVI